MDLVILLLTVSFTLLLGLVVFARDWRASYAKAFMSMAVFIVVWIIANYITNFNSSNLRVTNTANSIAYVGGYLTILSGLYFTYCFPERIKVRRYERLLVGLISIVIIILSCTNFIAGHAIVRDGQIEFTVGRYLLLYVVGFLGLLGLIVRNLTFRARQLTAIKKTQSHLILAAFVSSALAGLLLNVVLPSFSQDQTINSTRFGPLVIIILVGIISYTIIRHSLFDIRQAVVRTIGYVLSLVTLGGIYYVAALTFSSLFFHNTTHVESLNVILALALAFIFQPVKSFFDRVTDNIFFRDRYNSSEFFGRLSEVLTTTTDLRNLLQRAAREIGSTLKSEPAFFFVRYSRSRHLSVSTSNHKTLPVYDIDTLDDFVKEAGNGVIITELLEEGSSVRRLLMSHKIALLLPLAHETDVIGYLALGDKRGGNYTNRDTRVLVTIADELVIAIQNALSVQEVKDVNANLQQRVEAATTELRSSNDRLRRLDATKDEFLSMASHQLRTPLTSVKGYLSMVLDGDVGKVTSSQAKLLGEAYASSERMVHLINDFLNVSRLQTGKFVLEKQATNLADMIQGEVKSLQATAKSRGIKLKLDIKKAPKDEFMIDEAKLRQVVMNFIDNALYYSHEKDVITVTVRQVKNEVEVVVEDTGIGVPKDEQAKLFTKFYRASNARRQRPDGTGVGLFLSKKVIDAHKGTLIFKSVEDKGSTFGFRLPLDKIKL